MADPTPTLPTVTGGPLVALAVVIVAVTGGLTYQGRVDSATFVAIVGMVLGPALIGRTATRVRAHVQETAQAAAQETVQQLVTPVPGGRRATDPPGAADHLTPFPPPDAPNPPPAS